MVALQLNAVGDKGMAILATFSDEDTLSNQLRRWHRTGSRRVGEDSMKRRLAVLGAVLAAGLLVAVLVFLVTRGPGRAPETWQTALEMYLTHKNETAGDALETVVSHRAFDPTVFGASMRAVTYGRGVYYQSDATYVHKTPTPGVFGLSPSMSLRPLPYPPTEVWCVLLRSGDGESESPNAASSVVFVALHQDLYNAAWVVHEAETLPLSRASEADLAKLGCTSILEYD